MSEYTEENNTDSEETNEASTSKYTEVKTGYARAAMSLLAVNLFLTGYCVLQISNYQGEQIDGVTQQNNQQAEGNTVKAITKPETTENEEQDKQKED
jgi:hypothetical protein